MNFTQENQNESNNKQILKDMKSKGFAYLNPEEFFEFLTEMHDLSIHGFFVQKAIDRFDTYIIYPDKKTKKKWNRN